MIECTCKAQTILEFPKYSVLHVSLIQIHFTKCYLWLHVDIVEQDDKKKDNETKKSKDKRRKSKDADAEENEDEDGEDEEGTTSIVAKWGVGGINRPVMRANKKYSLCPLHIAIEGGHLVRFYKIQSCYLN